MKTLFLSHVAEDETLALELAKELEAAGYGTWCFESDSLPGVSYLDNTREGIDESRAFLLLVSLQSMGSRQVEIELEHAHEESKPIFPLLLGVKDADYKKRKPRWAQMIGTSTSVAVSPATLGPIAQMIAKGLNKLGISASPSATVSRRDASAETFQSQNEPTRTVSTPRLKTEAPKLAQAKEWRKTAGSEEGGEEARPSFQWHYIHPEFQRELLERLGSGKALRRILAEWSGSRTSAHLSFYSSSSNGWQVGGLGENAAGDLRPFLEAGCVGGFDYHSGRLSFYIDVDALLVTGSEKLVGAWLSSAKPEQEQAMPRLFLLKKLLRPQAQRPTATDFDHEAEKQGFGPCLRAAILWRYHGSANAARDQLAPAKGMGKVRMLLALDGELEAVCNHLRQAERTAKSFWEWQEIAESWKGLLNNDSAARRSLGHAETVAKDSWNWRSAAMGWKKLFNDDQEARRALGQAEAAAKSGSDWELVGEGWKRLFNDEPETRRTLDQAKGVAKNSSDWKRIAMGWKGMFNDEPEARRALAQAEALAKGSLDWKYVADGWKEAFNDEPVARRCLGQAEALAKSSLDWKWAAESWNRLFSDEPAARRCLSQAEALAKSGLDWKWVAESWNGLFSYDPAARRCLGEAEAAAKDSSDWRDVAEGWKQLFSDEAAARRCLGLAEATAKNIWDWQRIARIWKNHFNDEAAARRCLGQAEAAVERGSEWKYVAEAWKELFDDEAAARRCFSQAEVTKSKSG